MRNWPFGDLKPASYRVILADPPWSWSAYSAKGLKKSPEAHYSTMPMAAIQALPVHELAHPEWAVLVMWATGPLLPLQCATLAAWGFTYKTAGGWAKLSKHGTAQAFGGGYWLRNAGEFTLWGARGAPRQRVKNIRSFIIAPVREHSRKPERMHEDLEAMFEGPRCELFARQARPGWDAWGNETGKFA